MTVCYGSEGDHDLQPENVGQWLEETIMEEDESIIHRKQGFNRHFLSLKSKNMGQYIKQKVVYKSCLLY